MHILLGFLFEIDWVKTSIIGSGLVWYQESMLPMAVFIIEIVSLFIYSILFLRTALLYLIVLIIPFVCFFITDPFDWRSHISLDDKITATVQVIDNYYYLLIDTYGTTTLVAVSSSVYDLHPYINKHVRIQGTRGNSGNFLCEKDPCTVRGLGDAFIIENIYLEKDK
jgi:hypothetical protein